MTDAANNTPSDAAAYWFTRMQAHDMSDAEYAAFDAWFRAAPAHRQEYRTLERIWLLAGQLTDDDCARLTGMQNRPNNTLRSLNWRNMAIGMGVASVLFAAIGLSGWTGDSQGADTSNGKHLCKAAQVSLL